MNADVARLNEISERIIGYAFTVGNALGHGFLEKVYENALTHEQRKSGLAVVQQRGIEVRYDGVVVGEYVVDLLVDGQVLVEIKTVRALDNMHSAQCLNYLKATGHHLCLLINFAKPRVEIRRIVLDL
jgi:GxxExxY protein